MSCPNVKADEEVLVTRRDKRTGRYSLVPIVPPCKKRGCVDCSYWVRDDQVAMRREGAWRIGLKGLWLPDTSDATISDAAFKTTSRTFNRLSVDGAEVELQDPAEPLLFRDDEAPPTPRNPLSDPNLENVPVTSTLSHFFSFRETVEWKKCDKPQRTTQIRPQRLVVSIPGRKLVLSTHDLSTRAATFRYVEIGAAFDDWVLMDPTIIKRVQGTDPGATNPYPWVAAAIRPTPLFAGRGKRDKLVRLAAEYWGIEPEDVLRGLYSEAEIEELKMFLFVHGKG